MSTASFRPSARVSRSAPRRRRRRSARAALTVWSHGTDLDRYLAAGADPSASEELALRAHSLTTARSRRRVANALAGVLCSAGNGNHIFTAAVRPRSQEVLEAAPVIASIERQLRAAEPVAVQGVAQLRLLLIDGNGPLYQPSDLYTLVDCLQDAAAALSYARD